jgi:hypothetical protein
MWHPSMFMWGEGGDFFLESGNCTFSFHVGLRLLVITLVFFYVKTSLVEKNNPLSFYDSYQNLQCSTTWNLKVLMIKSTQHMKNYIHVKIFILWTLVISTLANDWIKILSSSPNHAHMHSFFPMGKANKQIIFLHK